MATWFYDLARRLGADQPSYGLQALGLDGQAEPHKRLEEMAAYYIAEIKSVQPEGPYYLGGHSFGGLVAFEMAQQLQRAGDEIGLLAVLDTSVPTSEQHADSRERDDAEWLIMMGREMARASEKDLDVSYEEVAALSPEQQLRFLVERLKSVDALPPEATSTHLSGLLNVLKANNQMEYVPHKAEPIPIAVFRAAEDPPEEMEEDQAARADPALGWERLSEGPVQVYCVPGDHHTMMTEPNIDALAEQINSCREPM